MSTVTTAPTARLLNIEQAAAYLGVDARFMRRLILERRIRHAKVGKYVRSSQLILMRSWLCASQSDESAGEWEWRFPAAAAAKSTVMVERMILDRCDEYLPARRRVVVTAAYGFVLDLDAIGVPLFTASPAADREFNQPTGWSQLTAGSNHDRLDCYREGDAISGVMGGAVAAIDVDTRNGGDLEKVRQLLAGLGVTVFAEVETPGGGAHFYIAGHPDLPTVHATADRPALKGYPGVEIVSYGANVFLPGTERPKYGGRGYQIVFNNLAAVADGGDPDGAETFAAWVAEHRHTPKSEEPLAPPWDGTPPDARQAAYLAGVLRNHHDRIAAMGKQVAGGRRSGDRLLPRPAGGRLQQLRHRHRPLQRLHRLA